MYSRLTATLEYLDETLKQINEAWEGIVVELDRKLASYADTMEPHRLMNGCNANFSDLNNDSS